MRKYNFNQTAFDVIDSEEKSYWLGFLMGDGNVHKRKTSINVELSNVDKPHLEKLSNFLSYDGQIKETVKNCVILRLHSIYMSESLSKYGFIPNKTQSVLTPNIDQTLLSYFYRGILDADGWITEHKKDTKIQHEYGFSSANINFLYEIKSWINKQCNNKKEYGYIIERKRGKQKCCQLIFGGNNNFVKITDLIYNKPSIYLDRKYTKIQSFIEYINQPRTLSLQ